MYIAIIEGANLESVDFDANEVTITLSCNICPLFLYHVQLHVCSHIYNQMSWEDGNFYDVLAVYTSAG